MEVEEDGTMPMQDNGAAMGDVTVFSCRSCGRAGHLASLRRLGYGGC